MLSSTPVDFKKLLDCRVLVSKSISIKHLRQGDKEDLRVQFKSKKSINETCNCSDPFEI